MSSPRRYPSDLTGEQWALLELLLPEPDPRAGGRPRRHPRREIVNAILYVVRSGGGWRQLPADFPPWQTVKPFGNYLADLDPPSFIEGWRASCCLTAAGCDESWSRGSASDGNRKG